MFVSDSAYARDHAILQAREALKQCFLVLDTETTGLKHPEVCQLAFITTSGVTFNELFKPTIPIEQSATDVHHITNEQVQRSPRFGDRWPAIRSIMMSTAIYGYNATYDIRAINNSLKAYGITDIVGLSTFDVMLCFAAFRGELEPKFGTYKWATLGEALEFCGLQFGEEGAHSALEDARMTNALLWHISNCKTSWEKALDVILLAEGPGAIDWDAFGTAVSEITYKQ